MQQPSVHTACLFSVMLLVCLWLWPHFESLVFPMYDHPVINLLICVFDTLLLNNQRIKKQFNDMA